MKEKLYYIMNLLVIVWNFIHAIFFKSHTRIIKSAITHEFDSSYINIVSNIKELGHNRFQLEYDKCITNISRLKENMSHPCDFIYIIFINNGYAIHLSNVGQNSPVEVFGTNISVCIPYDESVLISFIDNYTKYKRIIDSYGIKDFYINSDLSKNGVKIDTGKSSIELSLNTIRNIVKDYVNTPFVLLTNNAIRRIDILLLMEKELPLTDDCCICSEHDIVENIIPAGYSFI